MHALSGLNSNRSGTWDRIKLGAREGGVTRQVMSEGRSHSENPWASLDVLSGINLGNPQSALVQARRFGLGNEDSPSQVSGLYVPTSLA